MSLTYTRDNTYQVDLFEKKILNKYFLEYMNNGAFGKFASAGKNSVICLENHQKHAGDTVVIEQYQNQNARLVFDDEQLAGNEQKMIRVSDNVKLNHFRYGVPVFNKTFQEVQLNVDLMAQARQDLLNKMTPIFNQSVIGSFACAFRGAQVDNVLKNLTYSDYVDRILASPLDQLNGGMSRSRVLIGTNYLTTQATMEAALVIGNLPIADHKPSVRQIIEMARLARTGRSKPITGGPQFTSQEAAIQPHSITFKNGYADRKYVLFVSPTYYVELTKDPEWQAQVSRGYMESGDQPTILYGSDYKGMIGGVMIIEIPELDNMLITNAAGNVYAYSILCGAGAVFRPIVGTPQLRMRSDDYDYINGIAHVEVSGIKVPKYPSKSIGVIGNNANLTENGLIHCFAAIS